MNGSLQLSVDNEIDIEYNNFSINELNNKSQIILTSGFSIINKENINLKNIIIESENIKGNISGIVNIYDYEKSNLEIDLENFKNIYEENSYQILGAYINNINNSDDISIEIKNIFFNEHKFDNINAKLKKNKKVINGNIKLSYLDNIILFLDQLLLV